MEIHQGTATESKPVEEAADSEAQQEAVPCSAPAAPTEEDDTSKTPDPPGGSEESSTPEMAQETEEHNAVVNSETEKNKDDEEHPEETNGDTQKGLGLPTNPPPPPKAQNSPRQDTGLTGGMGEENGEGPFFQTRTPAKPPALASE
ncbi:submandibular gland secretory Glx-rich protein CA-like isoform X2 [Sphaeramia orbicularis]|uniref:submandibular gland secretory Glx-rich protein CA-like isoform X2 n=1 Tax=Sphaeramia orbicularis TaxID=375764 RepID=UPI00117C3880|nr:submandibular gland secretory Glx-rich protein CA-like isoform X2 [Sphaeramia orbicularis]